MKYCNNCGAELKDEAKFCGICGVKQEDFIPVEPSSEEKATETAPTEELIDDSIGGELADDVEPIDETDTVEDANDSEVETSLSDHSENHKIAPAVSSTKKSKSIKIGKKGLIGIVGAALATLIALLVIVKARPITIDLTKYVTADVTGYNTVGRADYEFNWDGFYRDVVKGLYKKGNIKKAHYQQLMNSFDIEDAIDTASDYIDPDLGLSQTSGLSNGDKITLEGRYEEQIMRSKGLRYKGFGSVIKTVEGLPEIKEVDPFSDEYVTITSVGRDGYGEIAVTPKNDTLWVNELVYKSNTDKLSNGDKVSITASPRMMGGEDYIAEAYGVRLAKTTTEYTVSGLEETETFDAFDQKYLVVNFGGMSGAGTIQLNRTDEGYSQALHFVADKTENLKNGDIVTVSIQLGDYNDNNLFDIEWSEEEYISAFGCVPESMTKQYEVSGLAEYVTSISQIPANKLDEVKRRALEKIYSVADSWENTTIKDAKYVGIYFLTRKAGFENYNRLITTYQVDADIRIGGSWPGEDSITFFYCTEIDNVQINSAGECLLDFEATKYTENDIKKEVVRQYERGTDKYIDTLYFKGYDSLDTVLTRVIYADGSYNVEEQLAGAESSEEEKKTEEEKTEEKKEEKEAESKEENGVKEVLPNSSKEVIGDDVIKKLSLEQTQYAINELLARHGYIFEKENEYKKGTTWKEYFEQFGWYKPTVASKDFDIKKMLNDTEIQNYNKLEKHRDELKDG